LVIPKEYSQGYIFYRFINHKKYSFL
jgi:hypothetical protein